MGSTDGGRSGGRDGDDYESGEFAEAEFNDKHEIESSFESDDSYDELEENYDDIEDEIGHEELFGGEWDTEPFIDNQSPGDRYIIGITNQIPTRLQT